jgi:DNA-binding XRE family transcriptional regulator
MLDSSSFRLGVAEGGTVIQCLQVARRSPANCGETPHVPPTARPLRPTAKHNSTSIHRPEQPAFRQRMIAARKKAGLTQETLTNRLINQPHTFVAKYEGGERRIDVLEFLTIAQAIGAKPARLLKVLIRQVA